MQANDLFTAPQLAKLCSTDLKTIHNWVSRGEIKFFRTPGRHLRFRRDDIVEFLTKFGYPVPDGFAMTPRRVVVIDGAAGTRDQIARTLGNEVDVQTFSDYLDAAVAIGRHAPTVVCINADGGPELIHAANRLAVCAASSKVVVYGAAIDPDGLDEALLTIKPGDCSEIGRVVRSLLKSS